MALSGGETLSGMITDLLDVSKMEAGEMTLEYADFPPATLVERVVHLLQPLARQKKLELVADAEPELPIVRADQEKVRRIVVNLVGNALKFTRAGGSVTVRARRGDVSGSPAWCSRLPTREKESRRRPSSGSSRSSGRSRRGRLGATPRPAWGRPSARWPSKPTAVKSGSRASLGKGSTFSFTLPLHRRISDTGQEVGRCMTGWRAPEGGCRTINR